jgi:DNA polymerase-3 subunit gamma/tau
MVGQEASLRALANALDSQRLHHAYLFTGTRGVGKTSVARIIAKCLNCERGISSKPCETCSACVGITEGRFVDLIEVDAASKTKVEDTRDLLENVQYMPTRGRFKIYLIDEVHMLSGHSFNALLKTLEEPPSHVKFLLATTDPQKLPVTILSRCLQFHLKRLPFEQIVDHLKYVVQQEGVQAERAALETLSRSADGSLRDALSLLDQAIAYGMGRVLQPDVDAMLGLSETGQLIALFEALLAGDAKAVFEVIADIASISPDFQQVLSEFLILLHQIAIAGKVPEALDNSIRERDRILQLATQVSEVEIQSYYQCGLHGQRDLPYAPNPKMGFEMVLLRMLSKGESKILPVQNLRNDNKTLDSRLRGNDARKEKHDSLPQNNEVAKEALDSRRSLSRAESRDGNDAVIISENKMNNNINVDNNINNNGDSWSGLIPKLGLTGLIHIMAQHCTLIEQKPDYFHLMLEESQKPLLNKRHEDRLQEALSQYFKKAINLKITVGSSSGETPAGLNQRLQNEAEQNARLKIENDPTVRELMQTFDAKIENVSIT